MARTVIPPSGRRAAGAGEAAVAVQPGDPLPEKLVKYVPAETLAFLLPASALIGDRTLILIVVLLVAAGGNLLYLSISSRKLPDRQKPRPYFWVLATIALAGWSVGTIPSVAALVNADYIIASLVLLGTVFLVPAIDQALTKG